MCRLEDLIDNRPLLELIQSINSGDNTEFTTLLQNSLSPLVADSKFISFTAWKIDVTGTIYSRATLSYPAFWTIARKLRQNSVVRDYMIISAYGLILLFVSNQAIVLVNVPYPPFGMATISFMGLSSYLVLLGIYSSAISVSEDSKLRQSIRNLAIKESKLLDSIGTAHMEQEIQKRVLEFTKRTQDMMAEETGIKSSMTEDDIKQYLEQVVREVKIQKTSTNHNNKTSRHSE